MKSGENRLNGIRPEVHEEILGIFLREGELFGEYKNRLNREHFYGYGWLYQLMLDTYNETGMIDFQTLARRSPKQIEILRALRSLAVSVKVLPGLISNLKKNVLAERIRMIASDLIEKAAVTDGDELLREMQEKAFMLYSSEAEHSHDPETDVEEWHTYLKDIMDDPSKAFGLMTGLDDIDKLTTGYHRTDFIVIGARPSIGKSAFMVDTILRLNQAGYKTAIFSLEMSKRQLYNRMLANLMGASLEVLRTGQLARELFPQVATYKPMLKQIYVDDSRAVSADYIVDEMRRIKRTRGLDFVAVDYLQDVKEQGESNDNSGSALARVCRKLRAGAKECDCAVMGLSQVTRGVEDRKDKRPTIADLSGSTGIETAADVIGMLYRDDYYNPDGVKNILEVNFGKQRNGKVGKVELFYDRSNQRILPIKRR